MTHCHVCVAGYLRLEEGELCCDKCQYVPGKSLSVNRPWVFGPGRSNWTKSPRVDWRAYDKRRIA
jgi:hypothetical protein